MTSDPHDLDDHGIEQLFRDITPEDFHQDHSAVGEYALTSPFTPDKFAAFIHTSLNDWRLQYQQNRWHNQASLFGDTQCRLFVAEADETPAMFASRLTREARALRATYAVIAVVSPARHWVGDGNDPLVIDQDDEAAVEAALAAGLLRMAICWSAMFRDETGGITTSAGYSSLDGDLAVEGEFADDNPYGSILED